MTGGGSVESGGVRAHHGFVLRCNPGEGSSNLQVNWGRGERFHLESLAWATCGDNPGIMPNPPDATFDTHQGMGTGRYNGESGATATWTFTDAGEPGRDDFAQIVIRDAGGNIVLAVSGTLSGGNHQAHGIGGGGLITPPAITITPAATQTPRHEPRPSHTPRPTKTPKPTKTPRK
jgi:hypothetical protein